MVVGLFIGTSCKDVWSLNVVSWSGWSRFSGCHLICGSCCLHPSSFSKNTTNLVLVITSSCCFFFVSILLFTRRALLQHPIMFDSPVGWVKDAFFWISNLHIKQTMYFGVKLRTFQGFFIPVWFRVGQVQKTELSSHLKTLKLSAGGGAMFNLSWPH